MRKIDQAVADTMNSKHQKQAEAINRKRQNFPRLKVGEKMWYLRPAKVQKHPLGSRLYWENKLAVPTVLQKGWVREHHFPWAHWIRKIMGANEIKGRVGRRKKGPEICQNIFERMRKLPSLPGTPEPQGQKSPDSNYISNYDKRWY
jgi:hypothetical protein